MDHFGIRKELQNAITTPECNNIRLTASLKFWLVDALTLRFSYLQEIQQGSRLRLERSRKENSQDSPRPSRGSKAEPQEVSTPPVPIVQALRADPGNSPAYITLWKGVHMNRVSNLRSAVTGELSLEDLLTNPPSDFNGKRRGLYWALDIEVAQKYCDFAKKYSAAKCVIVRMTVPIALIEKVAPYQLPCGDLWKQVVWLSRRQQPLEKELRFLRSEALLIGSISHNHTRTICQLLAWEELDESHVMMIDTERGTVQAIQYAFNELAHGGEALEHLAKSVEVKFFDRAGKREHFLQQLGTGPLCNGK
jgi:hypothetical protein